jgi:hypothetical protein
VAPQNMTFKSIKPQGMTRTEWLAKLGVPAPFRGAIIDAPNDWMTTAGGVVIGLAMVAIAVGIMVAALMSLDAYVQARAVALATQIGAPLVYVDVGMGPLVLLFGLIALMGWFSSVLSGRHRVNGFLSSAAAMLNGPPKQVGVQWVMQRLLRGTIRRAAGAATVDDFLRDISRRMSRRWAIATIVLLPPAVILTVLETNSFWVAGTAGIVEHRMFPPFSSRSHDLSEAATLTTGCNHTEDNENLIYDIGFPPGLQYNLGRASAVEGSKLTAIEAIDAQIGGRVEHRRWSHLDRNPLHPTCLDHWMKQFDSDGRRRLGRLLHVTAR